MQRKDKAAEQREAKRKGGASLTAPERTRAEKPVILIVCEGENTEPSYFRQFRLTSAKVKPVGEGYNTKSLVERAIQLRAESDYDQVWVVFDKDDFPSQNFHDAIQLAEREDIGLAWSNQSFEYWLLLHFDDHQGGGMHRNQYGNRINKLIGPLGEYYDYNGSKLVDERFFTILESRDPKTKKPRREIAIDRAKRIRDHWQGHTPAESESCTLVFQLVEEIIKYV
jgi:RloB-like protein